MSRRILSMIMIAAILANSLVFFLIPRATDASVKSTAVSFTGCFVAGLVTPIVQNLINDGISKLEGQVSQLGSGLLSKFTGGLLSGLGAVPVQDSTVASTIGAYTENATRQQIITRCAAWALMNQMTTNTLNIIRTAGPYGGPVFVKNWTNFETQSQYRGEGIFRAELANTNLCSYFANDVKQSFGVSPTDKVNLSGLNTRVDSLQPYNLQMQCTLPSNFNMTAYQQNFAANGGWDAWAQLLQPQNNKYGVYFYSQSEIQKQRDLQQTADNTDKLANNGLSGVTAQGNSNQGGTLPSGPNNVPAGVVPGQGTTPGTIGQSGQSISSYLGAATGNCQIYFQGQCLKFNDIKTPGSYLAQSLGASIGAQYSWLTSAQGLNTIIADATEVMLNRLLDLGNPDEGNYHPNDQNNITLPTPTIPIGGPNTGTSPGSSPNPSNFSGPDAQLVQCLNVCVNQDDVAGCESNCNNAYLIATQATSTPSTQTANGKVCATQQQIDQFLKDNPGDEGRLSSAFPCNQ